MKNHMQNAKCKKFRTADELVAKLRQTDSIPALDENVVQLSRLTSEHNTSASDLTAVIMRDPALTARLLTVANSVTYRPRLPVRTISSAVVLFGFGRVRQLALGLSVFNQHTGAARDKELYRLLVCAYCSGNIALHLGHALKDEEPEELFVAGLLHQLPRLILANGFPEQYQTFESLTVQKGYDIEQACKEVFGIYFHEIVAAIANYWHLDDKIGTDLTPVMIAKRKRAVELSVEASNLLFGNLPTGHEPTAKLAESMQDLIKTPTISLPEFIGACTEGDPNMGDFFNLTSEDMVMMTRIAEWGKVSSTDVANTLTNTRQKKPEPPTTEINAPLGMALFLSELMLAIRDNYSCNDILMMAQEGIYRCISCECVFAAFLVPNSRMLQGRLYAGQRPGVAANRLRIQLDESSQAAKAIEQNETTLTTVDPQHKVLHDDRILYELGLYSILLAPIYANRKPIGAFVLGRKQQQPAFTADDKLAMSAIASHVGLSFEQPN